MPLPSKPAAIETTRQMTAEEAMAILSSNWSPNVRMWKYKGCQFGDDPRQWPPLILSALAVLAQTAGPNHRVRAMQIVAGVMGRVAIASPEHITRAAELLEAERLHAAHGQPVRGPAMVNHNFNSSLDEKVKEISGLNEEIKKAQNVSQQKLLEMQKRIDAVEMKSFEMDATLSVVSTDRDMFKMYWDVAEMHKKRLEKENSELKRVLQEKDAHITKVVDERDQAIRTVREQEQILCGLVKTG